MYLKIIDERNLAKTRALNPFNEDVESNMEKKVKSSTEWHVQSHGQIV